MTARWDTTGKVTVRYMGAEFTGTIAHERAHTLNNSTVVTVRPDEPVTIRGEARDLITLHVDDNGNDAGTHTGTRITAA